MGKWLFCLGVCARERKDGGGWHMNMMSICMTKKKKTDAHSNGARERRKGIDTVYGKLAVLSRCMCAQAGAPSSQSPVKQASRKKRKICHVWRSAHRELFIIGKVGVSLVNRDTCGGLMPSSFGKLSLPVTLCFRYLGLGPAAVLFGAESC